MAANGQGGNQIPYVYILRCADGTYYTGWTQDLERRVAAHNAGRGARYTRSRRPVRLVYSEVCADRAEAMRREVTVKRLSRRKKRQLAKQFGSKDGAIADERARPST